LRNNEKENWFYFIINYYVLISLDDLRIEFTGNINNKTKDKKIYQEAILRTIVALKQNKNVIFDSTNLTKERRLPFIESVKKSCQIV
jgi:predicted kinase